VRTSANPEVIEASFWVELFDDGSDCGGDERDKVDDRDERRGVAQSARRRHQTDDDVGQKERRTRVLDPHQLHHHHHHHHHQQQQRVI